METFQFKSYFVYLLFLAFISSTQAQSTLDTVETLGNEIKAIKSEFVSAINGAIEKPDTLQSGEFKTQCVQFQSSLEMLTSRIDEATEILSKREAEIASIQGLGENDKNELKQVLQNQRKPLEGFKQSTSSMKKDINNLVEKDIDSISNVYKSFLDISGPTKAKEKVEEKLRPLLSAYLPPKPKPTPTPTPRREIPPKRSSSTSTQSPADPETQDEALKSIADFIDSYFSSLSANDPNITASYYADEVQYCYANNSTGRVSRSTIWSDTQKLINRYPQRNYRNFDISDMEVVGDFLRIHFTFDYEYHGKKNAQGTVNAEIDIKYVSGNWKIFRFEESVTRR